MSEPAKQPAPPRGPGAGVLLGVADLLSREVDLDALLAALVDRIARALGADRGTIYLVDKARGELFSRAAHLPELPQIRLQPGQGLAGHVARTGEVVNVPRTTTDARFFRDVDAKTGYRTETVLAVPMRDARGEIAGVVQLLNKPGGFTAGDETLLAALAHEVVSAIEATALGSALRSFDTGKAPAPPFAMRFNRVVGESEKMRAVFALAARAAQTDATVLVRGESGTGKELIARAVHVNSKRREQPFVKVDCAALPATLVENELFGHEKGAFTGADRRASGKFEAASGGTVFIDEIGELPLPAQGKLLGILQDRELVRVGGTEPVPVDVRVVAATHRDLEGMVKDGLFREDLYYRVRVVSIALPPLRERGPEDVARLVRHFVDAFARKHGKDVPGITAGALARLQAHPWPGNVRELENCIESAVVLSDGGPLDAGHLPLPAGPPGAPAPAPAAGVSRAAVRSLADVERDAIAAALEAFGGNHTRAAEALGIGRNTLNRKIKAYGL